MQGIESLQKTKIAQFRTAECNEQAVFLLFRPSNKPTPNRADDTYELNYTIRARRKFRFAYKFRESEISQKGNGKRYICFLSIHVIFVFYQISSRPFRAIPKAI